MTRALLLHGLNNAPSAMDPIAVELARRGFDVRPGFLTGHYEREDRLAAFRKVDADIWLRDARAWYAREYVPGAVFVGFSLGALLGLLLQQEGAVFDRLLLFAPTIALHRWSYIPGLFRRLDWVIPSAMPAALSANRGTPTRAYGALYDLVARFAPDQPPPPTTVVMNQRDELVNGRRVRTWAARHGASWIDAEVRGRKHLVLEPAFIPPSFTP